jgi:hypothetical protein
MCVHYLFSSMYFLNSGNDRAHVLATIAMNERYIARTPHEDPSHRACTHDTDLLKTVLEALDTHGDVLSAAEAHASWRKVYRTSIVLGHQRT